MKSVDVLGLGIATIDILTQVPRSPKPDEVMSVPGITVCGGGPVATALVELARLGNRTEYLGTIAMDMWGEMIERDFDREGVSYGGSPRVKDSQSTVSVILVEQSTASRSILYHSEGMDRLSPDAITPESISRARLLHLDGFHLEAALRAATFARESGVVVSLDGGAGERLSGMEELLGKIDIMIVARQFAATFTGTSDVWEAARRLGGYGARQVVVTDGARGSWFWDGRLALHQEAFPVKAVDTTGAGDVYHGAYLHAFLQGWSPQECLRFASAAAALKCTHLGGRSGPASQDEVRQFIGKHRGR